MVTKSSCPSPSARGSGGGGSSSSSSSIPASRSLAVNQTMAFSTAAAAVSTIASTTSTSTTMNSSSDTTKPRRNSPTSVLIASSMTTASSTMTGTGVVTTNVKSATSTTTNTAATTPEAKNVNNTNNGGLVATSRPVQKDNKFWKKAKAPQSAAAAAVSTTTTKATGTTTTNATPPRPPPTATSSNDHVNEDADAHDAVDDDSSLASTDGTQAHDDDDDDDDDDDVVGGILAVGVLKKTPPTTTTTTPPPSSSSSKSGQATTSKKKTKPPTSTTQQQDEEATQLAISKTVAENLAEQEHKAKARTPAGAAVITKKRRSLSIRDNKISKMALAKNSNATATTTTTTATKAAAAFKKSSATAAAAAATTPPFHPPATASRSTIQRTMSSDDDSAHFTSSSSHDEMMSIKNREKRRASRDGTGATTMHARRLQRASSRASHAASSAGWSSSSDDDESRTTTTTVDQDAKIKDKMSRSKSIQAQATQRRASSSTGTGTLLVRTKSGDSTSSGGGTSCSSSMVMAARKRAPTTSSRRPISRQGSLDSDDIDDDDENDHDDGPRLAPTISTGAAASDPGNKMLVDDDDDDDEADDDDDDDGPSLAVLPGAFSIKARGQHPDANNGKTCGDGDDDDDTGPSLAPQASTSIMSRMTSTSTNNTGEAAAVDDDDDGDERLEDVDTGVVVAPGAFVMYGPDHDPNSDSDDSSVNVVGDNPLDDDHQDLEIGAGLPAPRSSMNSHGMTGNTSIAAEPFLDDEPIFLPLQAMVYDPTVFDATILPQDGERTVDPKKLLRLRLTQLAVVLFSMAGIVFVVISIVRGFGSRSDNNTAPQDDLLTVQGWSLLGRGPIFGPAEEPQVYFGSAVAISGDGTLLAVAAPGTDQGSGTLVVGELHFFVEAQGDNGTEWTLLQGQSKPGPGPSNSDLPSSSLAMSRTGSHVVIGYPRFQGGQVQLYRLEGNAGDDGDGDATTDVTRDLSTGDPQWQTAGVLVSSADDERDTDASADPWFGYSVDVTPDGQYIAVGSPLTEPDETGSQRGAVYFYHFNMNNSTPLDSSSSNSNNTRSSTNETMTSSSSWTRLGDRLVGEPEEQYLGWSLALCSPLSSSSSSSPSSSTQQEHRGLLRVATGGPASNDGTGVVRVHELDVVGADGGEEQVTTSSWRQIGKTLVGSAPWLRFGESLAMSDDGTILAVGARGTSKWDTGRVQVFRLNSKSSTDGDEYEYEWIPDAQTLQGDQPGDGFGAAVSLSQNGTILAIGGPRSNAFAGGDKSEAVGHIKVFQFNSETKQWVQQGSSLGGSDAAAFGAALAISADGQRVAGGAPEADFDGTEVHAGSVLVFHVETAEQQDKEDGGNDNDKEGQVAP